MHEMFKLSFKTHQQTFQYQITFQLVKNMSNTHKVLANNEHLACFHGKNVQEINYIF
jgi:hypothetical protein